MPGALVLSRDERTIKKDLIKNTSERLRLRAKSAKRDPLTSAPSGVDLRFALLGMTGIAEEIKVKIVRLSF